MNSQNSDDNMIQDDIEMAEAFDKLGSLSYRQLIFRRFMKKKLGLTAAAVLIVFYVVAVFAGFFAPYHYNKVNDLMRYAPPQKLHFSIDKGLYVYGIELINNPVTMEPKFISDKTAIYSVRFFQRDTEDKLHLFGSEGPLYLLGTDRMGRDMLSRIIYGSRVSLTVGLFGVLLSLILGSILGTISGYFGGWVDNSIQSFIEILSTFPTIPLWMALAAALPPGLSSIQVYFGITIIISLVTWGALARQVRGKVLALREQDYVTAARSMGASHWRIIRCHLLGNCYSHIIVIATLAIPGMILGETALSFLGLGIRPPMTSWGVLLEDAQRVTVLLQYTWLLLPAAPVLIVVIAYNFLGDALRDAADPYSS